jgi:EmrB/QacA subfamily drug resistance transporter
MSKKSKWLGLFSLIPAIAMVFVDQSVLPVALPTIQKGLGASSIQLQWCINSYLLVTAVLLLAGGKVGDWIGFKRAFMLGMLIFAVSSALCGVSASINELILYRGLQGIGAALMVPASGALLMSLFQPGERGKATGLQASMSSLFLILGPLIGGYLTETLSWRWIFWINLPIAVCGIIMVYIFIPRSETAKPQFDIKGFCYFVLSSSSLVIFLMHVRESGFGSLEIISCLTIFVLSTFFLLLRERRAEHPFLDLTLFRHPIYRAVNISIFSIQFILMITVFRAIFFQEALGWSPLKTGVITVLSSLPILFISPIGGILSDKFGPKIPIAIGFLMLIFSFVWTAAFVLSPLPIFLIGLLAFGIGIPLIFTPSYASAMGAIPPTKAGSAFGTIATVRSLAASLGVALMGAFIDTVQLSSLETLAGENPQTSSLDPSIFKSIVAGGGQAPAALASVTPQQSKTLLTYYREAEVQGFIYNHYALAGLLVIALVFVFILYHRKSFHHLPDSPAEGWD